MEDSQHDYKILSCLFTTLNKIILTLWNIFFFQFQLSSICKERKWKYQNIFETIWKPGLNLLCSFKMQIGICQMNADESSHYSHGTTTRSESKFWGWKTKRIFWKVRVLTLHPQLTGGRPLLRLFVIAVEYTLDRSSKENNVTVATKYHLTWSTSSVFGAIL